MPDGSTVPYGFGDLLALARQSWVRELQAVLEGAGYADYRRSDALALRLLVPGPLAVGRLGGALGVTRQAAKKVATGLAARGYAAILHDAHDGRQVNVVLTERGQRYAQAIADARRRLDAGLARRLAPGLLAAADTVLRTALFDERARSLAARIPRPREGPGGADATVT
ncbi:MAG TPA: hypothetical protein VFQ96_01640 [Microbacteriaceae bacterium]|nr:hypothetical protein [Microbacteriaceae bacterium]